MQDYVGQQFCSYDQVSVVFDEPHFPELVHEVGKTRPRRADHFGEGLVTQRGDRGIGHDFSIRAGARASGEPGPAAFRYG